MLKTPVLFLIFNRPELTAQVFAAIRAARPQRLYVAADGPRADRPTEPGLCEQARKIACAIDWPCELSTRFQDKNLGCKSAVSSAISWFFKQEPEGIILEDDTLPNPSFFAYCSELLEKYRDDSRIGAISGDNFQQGRKVSPHSYYFSVYNHIWGWASWRRAWANYDVSMSSWSKYRDSGQLSNWLGRQESTQYWHDTFERMHQGAIDTWDYQWTFALWQQRQLSILPQVNLVTNLGFGEAATHTKHASAVSLLPTEKLRVPLRHPPEVQRLAWADWRSEALVFGLPGSHGVESELDVVLSEVVDRVNAGLYSEALQMIDALNKEIYLPELAYPQALAFARSDLMLEARESLSGLLEVCPEHTPAALLLQELAHHAPPSQASSETCAPQSSETTILESADLLLTRALEALQLNDPAAALALVDAAARQQQSTQDLHYVRAICCLKLSRIGEACQALQTELEKFPDNAAAKELLEQVQSEFSPEVAVTSAARSVSHQPSVSSETLVEEEPTAAATATPCNDQLQIVQASTESEVNLGSEQNASQARPNAELRRFQTPEQREARSVLSEEIRCSLQTGTQQYCLGGLQLQKNPFDFALQQRLIDSVRPKSVLDFGASSPASALWYAGVLQALSVDAIVLCGGSFTQAPTQSSALSKVSLRWELSAKPLSERVSPELLKSLPHPWLVRIDLQLPAAERASLLKKLRQELIAEDYLLVESDTLIQPELKDFLASHPGEYEVDTSYCDFFGYNATGCPNGYLRRKSEVLNSTLARPILQDFFQADRTHTTEAPAINQRFQLFYALREEFSRLKKKTWKFLLSMLEHPAAPCSSSSAKPWSSAARNEVPQAIVLGAGSSLGMNLPRK